MTITDNRLDTSAHTSTSGPVGSENTEGDAPLVRQQAPPTVFSQVAWAASVTALLIMLIIMGFTKSLMILFAAFD